MNKILTSKVNIWKLRNNNPMRKSYSNSNIHINEFEALAKITSEMSKYLYPYVREILQSRDNLDKNPTGWNEFKKRFKELIIERYNIKSIRVKNLLDPSSSDKILAKLLLTLAFSASDQGYQKLIATLLRV